MPSTWIEISTIGRRLPDFNGSWRRRWTLRWVSWYLKMNVLKTIFDSEEPARSELQRFEPDSEEAEHSGSMVLD
jgi:hypothetical protein